jgi:hypothetical protein
MNGGTKAGFSTISLEGLQCTRRGFRQPHGKKKKYCLENLNPWGQDKVNR